MKRTSILFILLSASVSVLQAADFMRLLQPEGKQPAALQTAVIHYQSEPVETVSYVSEPVGKGLLRRRFKRQARVVKMEPVELDLIGAIHIGDKKYYEALNNLFTNYDAVLFELVADDGVKVMEMRKNQEKNNSALSSIQHGMGRYLGLVHQLEYVDYTAKNFVHADLSPPEFVKRAAERGDIMQVIARSMILGASKAGDKDTKNSELQDNGRMIGALFASDPQLARKRLMAKKMVTQMDDSIYVIGGNGSAIISDRNAAALKVLQQEIDNGKRKIAIFYGGAHLAEMSKSVEKDFKMKKTGTDWLTAWDLTKEKK